MNNICEGVLKHLSVVTLLCVYFFNINELFLSKQQLELRTKRVHYVVNTYVKESKTKQEETIAVEENESHEKIQENGPQESSAQIPSQNESGECFYSYGSPVSASGLKT